jgi:antitoxin MazE
MITKITNYGDTLGIRFPKSLLEDVHISENDSVEVQAKNGVILITKQTSKNHYTTKERIAAFRETMSADEEQNQSSETDRGKPQGKEVW